MPKEAKVASPVRNMPAIATITVKAGDEHRVAGGGGCGLDRRPLAPAGGALLALPLQVEHRVVDADREPDQEHDRGRFGRYRQQLAGQRDSPKVANTAVSARSSGMPAATSAPNATTRMISVIGSENSPALLEVVGGRLYRSR